MKDISVAAAWWRRLDMPGMEAGTLFRKGDGTGWRLGGSVHLAEAGEGGSC